MKFKEYLLKDIATITMGQSPKSQFYNEDGKGIEFLQGVRTFGEDFPYFDTYTTKYNRLAYKNSILFSVRAPVGRVNWATKNIAIGRGVASISVKNMVYDRYVYYYFKKMGSFYDKKATGTVFTSIDKKELESLKIKIPASYDDQKRIADRLATLDRKIHLNQQLNANLVEISNTIFKQILISNDLHEFTINDIGTVAGGGTPSKKITSYWNGNIPWLSPKDLSNKPRIFTSSGENYITQQGLDNSSTKLLPRNTVLFSSRAPIGYLSIAKNRIATNQGFKSVIPNKQYPFWFIYELLKVETPRIINEANGSTFKEVSGSRLKQHIVYVPKSSDVLRYNSIFISLFQKMMQSESEIDTLNSLKRALLNKLF
ncbi:restriction endonuclease subunit S [Limosilactobacillus fermentum]